VRRAEIAGSARTEGHVSYATTRVAGATDLKDTIMAADAAWSAAFASGDAKAVAATYTASGQILATGAEPVKGTADLTKFVQGIFEEGAVS
jgi:ketosteroid isomerase-like protein